MQAVYAAELKLIEELIPKHSKSYWIWFHREWITSHMAVCDWQRELGLCTKLLAVDDRNCNEIQMIAKHFQFTAGTIEDTL